MTPTYIRNQSYRTASLLAGLFTTLISVSKAGWTWDVVVGSLGLCVIAFNATSLGLTWWSHRHYTYAPQPQPVDEEDEEEEPSPSFLPAFPPRRELPTVVELNVPLVRFDDARRSHHLYGKFMEAVVTWQDWNATRSETPNAPVPNDGLDPWKISLRALNDAGLASRYSDEGKELLAWLSTQGLLEDAGNHTYKYMPAIK